MKALSPYLKRIFIGYVLFAALVSAKAQRLSDSVIKGEQKAISILSKINIEEAGKRSKVQTVLASYFDSLTYVFAERKTAMDAARAQSSVNKELADARSEKAWDAAAGKLNKLHATFLGKLSSLLTTDQIEKVKDGMTEGLLHAEYRRFQELLPNLNEQHKTQIMLYLVEARENAMDAETKDMRQQWFIKYRGRANNYLAAAGYDLRKATLELEERKASNKKVQ